MILEPDKPGLYILTLLCLDLASFFGKMGTVLLTSEFSGVNSIDETPGAVPDFLAKVVPYQFS